MNRVTDLQIIDAIEKTSSLTAAAEYLSVSRDTLYKRMEKPSYQTAKRKQDAEIYKRLSGSLQKAAGKALSTLDGILSDKECAAGVKCRAAAIVLEYSLKFRDSCDFEERLQRLENLTESDK